ncbi:Negative regulator of mitotic exit [Entomortierella chlamydospora]|uniref:Negative regulator of mitotic exit n=1 Tax=Entomortierella chlamydospora TaxID=101097 RepID=A0A9P6N4B4_9FUNG|nr:Negative regulator of mitotic exit [Entomortierella chlamydospora]KAG0023103.1 Negative regulator of mitotic exit [Entomortierella chlamydospora]
MAGLFSRKNKKDQDDASSSSTNSNQRYHGRPSNSSNGRDNLRDNSSANDGVSYSPSDYSNQSPYPQQNQHQYSNNNNNNNGLSVYSSKNSLQYHQYQGNTNSATSFSTHQSTFNTVGAWSSGSVMSTNPFPRFAHTASYASTGNDIYVFGGIVKGSPQKDMHVIDAHFGGKDIKGKTSDTLYVLHTARKEWNKPLIQTLLPAPRHSHAACLIGTAMYITGGQYSGYYLNDIASFDMKTLNGKHPKWSLIEPKSSLPPARAGHCAATYDGKVYIFGGADDKYYYNDIWCYDPQTNKWEAVPAYGALPASRQGHTACVIEDTMYIYGGMNFEDQLLGDLCAFKFPERRWKTFINTPESASPRTEHSMCSVGNKIYILGGQLDLNANETPETVFVLDTTKISWNDGQVAAGSQRLMYDNDSLQYTDGGHEDRASPYSNSTPTPDLSRHQAIQDQNALYSHDSRRETHQSQHQQQQHYQDRSDQYSNQQLQQQQQQHQHQHQQHQRQKQRPHTGAIELSGSRTGLGITDGSQQLMNSAQSSNQIDDDFSDNTYVARRRTLGKPVGYVVHDLEVHRNSNPANGARRTASFESLRSSPYIEAQDRSYQQQRNNISGNFQNNSNSRSNIPLRHQLSNVELSRQGSPGNMSDQYRQRSFDNMDDQYRQGSPAESASRQSPAFDHNSRNMTKSTTPVPPKTGDGGAKEPNELKDLKQREQWLLAEVTTARKKMGDRPLSMAIMALEEELEACEIDSEKNRIMEALINVKSELERSKTSIATQAQTASNKVREAERVRTSALQEAAYLKAKIEALQTGDTSALVATETARASDLEQRLATALAQLDQYEAQFVQYETILEHEKECRLAAEGREREASSRAEEAQLAHTRAMNDISSLHERATVAEASLRDIAAKSATSEAGLSSYQQQSAALLSQISSLKTTVDHQKKSLDKAKLAYTVASERAEQADKHWTQSRQEIDQVQLELANVRSNMDRIQRESDHWKTKASETELLWQKAKKENEVMRTLLEEDMNASYSEPVSKARKHDSIIAITSASRHAELEHELTTLRQLLKDSQDSLAQANRDLGDTMVRISQLEQTSMAARAEAAAAQRQLREARDKVAMLQTQLIRKEEAMAEIVRDQENNEAQISVLKDAMKELENEHSRCPSSTALHQKRSNAGESSSEFEEEVAELHRQLHAAHQHAISLESQVQASQNELQSLKAQEQRKRGANSQTSQRVEQLEQSLAETKQRLEKTLEDLDHANELNSVTGQELEDALDALKKTSNGQQGASWSKRQEELEAAVQNAQKTIQSLRQTNQDLEQQLKASENKISLLLDNYQAPESVRDSVASFSGLTSGLLGLNGYSGLSNSLLGSSPPTSPPMMGMGSLSQRSYMDSSKQSSSSSGSRSNGGLTNSQKLEEYEKLIEEMTNARKQYED